MEKDGRNSLPEGFKVLIPKESLEKRIREIAEEVDKWFDPKNWVILAVLEGARPFADKVVKNLSSCPKWYPLQVSSYEGGFESTGKVRIVSGLDEKIIKGKHVLVIEDIVDTGRTVAFLKDYIKSKGAVSFRVATLLSKPSRRVIDVSNEVSIIGFEIPNLFVIGFGLDLQGEYRDLPMIGVLEKDNG